MDISPWIPLHHVSSIPRDSPQNPRDFARWVVLENMRGLSKSMEDIQLGSNLEKDYHPE